MEAVLLAGGFGKRLRAAVPGVPKPMAPVGCRPFLAYLLANLRAMGFREYIFSLHYEARTVMTYFGDGSEWDVGISYSIEEEPLGTGGAVGLLRRRLNGTFCVVNADTFLNLDFRSLANLHRRRSAALTMALARVGDPSRYGRITVDEDDRVLAFAEKEGVGTASASIPGDSCVNAGFYIASPVLFSYIPQNRFVSLEKDVLPSMLEARETIVGYRGTMNFFDIGLPEDYFLFQDWAWKNNLVGLEKREERDNSL